nr:hypothetical protein [Tanacetum cinerariifolium]
MVLGMQLLYPPVLANQFELKIELLNLVTAILFHGFENDDPHSHIRSGNFLTRNTQEAFTIVENKSKVRISRNKPQASSASDSSSQNDAITNLSRQVDALSKQISSMNIPIHAIQEGCETYGGPHPYYECQASGGYTQGVYANTGNYYSGDAFSSNTKPNPREQVNSFTTRNGLTTAKLSIPPHVPPTPRIEVKKETKTLMDEVHITSPTHVPPPRIQSMLPPKPKEDPKPNPHQHKIPYPLRMNKTKLLDKNDVQVSVLNILKQLPFDISLIDALTQIPKYHKVLKDLLKDKDKLVELENTSINAKCSAILLNKVLEKLEDPGKFLIPCVLHDLEVCNSLADFGASINLMPLSIYEELWIKPLKPTQMILKLVDPRVPIILGRPFLRTTKALVDLYEEKLTLRVGKEEVVCYTDKSSRKNSRDIQSVHCINIIDFSKDKPLSVSTTSHSNLSLPSYESFCFNIEEKSSATSHFNHSLSEYESFCF